MSNWELNHWNEFDRIVLINSDDQPQKLTDATRRLSAQGITFSRFPALKSEVEAGFLSKGHRGCFLSHYAVVENAFNAGAERLLIFEDDVLLRDNAASHVKKACQELADFEWHIFYLGAYLPVSENCQQVSKHLLRVKHSFHTHAYALSRAGMQLFLERLKPWHDRGISTFDFCLGNDEVFLRYHILPIQAIQAPGQSEIEGTYVNRIQEYFNESWWKLEDFKAHCSELDVLLR